MLSKKKADRLYCAKLDYMMLDHETNLYLTSECLDWFSLSQTFVIPQIDLCLVAIHSPLLEDIHSGYLHEIKFQRTETKIMALLMSGRSR